MARRASSRPPRGLLRGAHPDAWTVISEPVIPPTRVWLGALVRARAELAALFVLVTALVVLRSWLSWPAVGAVLVLVLAVVLAIPPTRHALLHRGQAVMTRHQLRATLVESRCWNASGRVPWLLWSRPSPVGETVWLLLPPGLAPADVIEEADSIASGCWARTARVTAARSNTALVRVEVFRRDPLTKAVIRSALADYEHSHGHPVPRGQKLVTPVDSTLHTVGARFRHRGADGRPPQPEPVGDSDHDLVIAAQRASAGDNVVVPVPRPTRIEDEAEVVADKPQDARPIPMAVARGGDWSDYV